MFAGNRGYDASSQEVADLFDDRYNGSNLMIDCGEGTQVAVKERAGVLNLLIPFVLRITMQIISAVCRGCF